MITAILFWVFAIIIFLLILSILVFIHEAGHFFVAKWSGIKVEEFGFGLPPRAWGIKRGETIYSLNWLPFGGFVKLFGEDEAGSGKIVLNKSDVSYGPNAAQETSRAFFAKPLANRIAVVFAGVFMNFVLAIALYYVVLGANGFKSEVVMLTDHRFVGVEQYEKVPIEIADVAADSPAKQAGINAGDKLATIQGQPIRSMVVFRTFIADHKGQAVALGLVTKDNQTKQVVVTPRVNVPKGEGPLGVAFGPTVEILDYQKPVQRLFAGFIHSYNVGTYSFQVLGQLLVKSARDKTIEPVSNAVAGPIRISVIVGALLGLGGSKAAASLLDFTALLSLNLAVVNILPFPALDGGRLLFLAIEGVTRRRVKPQAERVINTIGMALLLGLIFLVSFNDILKLVHQ